MLCIATAAVSVMSQAGVKHKVSTLSASRYLTELQSSFDKELLSFESVALFAQVKSALAFPALHWPPITII